MSFSKNEQRNNMRKLPTEILAEQAEKKEEQKFEQTGSPLHQVPRDVALLMFSFLNDKSLINVARTCKEMREIADSNAMWKIKCDDAGLQEQKEVGKKKTNEIDYKELYKSSLDLTEEKSVYYIVGRNIRTVGSSFFNPYGEYRGNIPKAEILKSLPTSGSVMVFEDLRDAERYAESKETMDYSQVDSMPAVFAVKLKGDLPKYKEEESIVVLTSQGVINQYEDQTVNFFRTNVNNIASLDFVKMDFKNITINFLEEKENQKSCVIS